MFALLVAAMAAAVPADAYLGRWNLLVTDAADSFRSGGLRVEKRGDGLAAELVWRSGSARHVKSAGVKDGVLQLVREERPGQLDAFTARLDGGELRGEVRYADGKTHRFLGRRAPELPAPATPRWGAPVTLFDGQSLSGWSLRDPGPAWAGRSSTVSWPWSSPRATRTS
jgi:hypothetical protein